MIEHASLISDEYARHYFVLSALLWSLGFSPQHHKKIFISCVSFHKYVRNSDPETNQSGICALPPHSFKTVARNWELEMESVVKQRSIEHEETSLKEMKIAMMKSWTWLNKQERQTRRKFIPESQWDKNWLFFSPWIMSAWSLLHCLPWRWFSWGGPEVRPGVPWDLLLPPLR